MNRWQLKRAADSKAGAGCKCVRDDIKAASAMIADEMWRQDAEVTAELAGGWGI